ncbi:MAG: proton-conducting transporter membrane subunit [Terriglobia bacterium]
MPFSRPLLFLGAGRIHAMGGEQDIRKMGGLKDKIRTTWWTMLVGTIAIAGFRRWLDSSAKTKSCGGRSLPVIGGYGSKPRWRRG